MTLLSSPSGYLSTLPPPLPQPLPRLRFLAILFASTALRRGQLKRSPLREALPDTLANRPPLPTHHPICFLLVPISGCYPLASGYKGGVRALPRKDRLRGRRSTCRHPDSAAALLPRPFSASPAPSFPGCPARVTSAIRSPPPPPHPPSLREPASCAARVWPGYGSSGTAAAPPAAAAASARDARAAGPRPLLPAARGHAELPAAVP